jgi:hypothetical protein
MPKTKYFPLSAHWQITKMRLLYSMVCMPVGPYIWLSFSACKNLRAAERILMKFDIVEFSN